MSPELLARLKACKVGNVGFSCDLTAHDEDPLRWSAVTLHHTGYGRTEDDALQALVDCEEARTRGFDA